MEASPLANASGNGQFGKRFEAPSRAAPVQYDIDLRALQRLICADDNTERQNAKRQERFGSILG